MAVVLINDFVFDGGSVFELKFVDIKSDNKIEKYQWYLVLQDKRFELKYKYGYGNYREFRVNIIPMDIWLDMDKMLLNFDKVIYNIKKR